jgi:hypothetical protein
MNLLYVSISHSRELNNLLRVIINTTMGYNRPLEKTKVVSATVAIGLLGIFGAIAPVTMLQQASATQVQTGSGAPSGAHYNLNLIGVPKGKTAGMTGDNGHRIFVPLEGNCKINLSMGDFQVLDANCTDGPSTFQLPNPDPDNDGITAYSVYARALGKPGGNSTTTTCFTDSTGTYCSIYQMVLVREKGKNTFDNVNKELLYVYQDVNGDGVIDRVPLFSDPLADYYWNYDNNGLKLAQLRFYEIPTNVN